MHIAQQRKAMTHCRYGHEYTPDNTSLAKKDGYEYRECKTCRRLKSKRSHQKAYYGITLEQKQEMLEKQGGKCANPNCRATEPGGNGDWHTDHDHRTGEVRGLLCSRCNVVLGHVNDDPAVLEGLKTYLQK